MPWIKDVELSPEESIKYYPAARVQLLVCGPEIFVEAARKDNKIEAWLATPPEEHIAS